MEKENIAWISHGAERGQRNRAYAAAVIFALLVFATLGAFAWSQHVKRVPLVLDHATFVGLPNPNGTKQPVHSFDPVRGCPLSQMRIRFRTTVSDDATVQVVKPGGKTVITLAREKFLKRYHFHTFYWNGHQRGGGLASPGAYKLRVKLLNEGRTLVPPGTIRLLASEGIRSSECGRQGASQKAA